MTKSQPLHITLRIVDGMPSLRQTAEYRAVTTAFAKGCDRFGFRLVHYAVLKDHLHLIVEGDDRRSVVRGIQGLKIRIAKALNKTWQRKGRVFFDRYHDEVLRVPRYVYNTLRYVLLNSNKHAGRPLTHGEENMPDPGTSGAYFDGWKEEIVRHPEFPEESFLAEPQSWLLRISWREYEPISLKEVPQGAR